MPIEQNGVGSLHAVVQLPQCVGVVRSVQASPQRCWFGGHAGTSGTTGTSAVPASVAGTSDVVLASIAVGRSIADASPRETSPMPRSTGTSSVADDDGDDVPQPRKRVTIVVASSTRAMLIGPSGGIDASDGAVAASPA